ncbi:hypothetical protein B566_EDAN014585 [Ephemera danica]|nr:hypothetical protein B566_EDAN014585 [Ephemera danica]
MEKSDRGAFVEMRINEHHDDHQEHHRTAREKHEDEPDEETRDELAKPDDSRQQGDDALTQTLSAFYCKLLVVLGIAFPVTEAIAPDTSAHVAYDGFYLFLNLGSIAFLLYMYATLLHEESGPEEVEMMPYPSRRRRNLEDSAPPPVSRLNWDLQALKSLFKSGTPRRSSVFGIDLVTWRQNLQKRPLGNEHVRYGSFYLRMGVAAFGVGSVIYSGLEFGRFFELKSSSECRNIFLLVTPLCRIIFVLLQMLFIFTNNKLMEVYRYKVVAKFGLMHMIATNLCEWLYVLIEETKNDILHVPVHRRVVHEDSLESDEAVSSEEESWRELEHNATEPLVCHNTNIMGSLLKDASPYLFPCTVEYSLLCAVILAVMWKNVCERASQNQGERKSGVNVIYSYFSVDCASAYKGLFTSIVLMVITIISLIMFFELVIGCIFSLDGDVGLLAVINVVVPIGALLQSACQTLVLLDASRRRCDSTAELREKPGRQLVTFLLVANLAIWAINRLKNSRIEFKPSQIDFYGRWPWAVITHVCVPLVVCYRFQSSVCLYEIWKRVYKPKPNII